MDCTRVEALLALFSGDDLDARQTERVRTHLAACPACQAQADEWAASRTWLQAAPPPQFDEAFYADLRQSVLRALPAVKPIHEEGGRLAWLVGLVPQWRWEPVLALATLAVLLFVSWAVYRKGSGQPPNKRLPDVATVNPTPTMTPEQKNAYAVNSPEKVAPGSLRNSGKAMSGRRKAVNPQLIVPTSARPEEPKAALLAQATILDVGTVPTAPTPEPEMTRIEFQTADPNIRIIWFAPKPDTAAPASK